MLSATTEHALRALTHMARVPSGTSILGRDLAEQASIPANYLSKILLALRNAGVVETTRGLGGGYRLCKSPDQIKLIDVAGLFEGMQGRPGCLLGEKRECSDAAPCTAHAKWKVVRTAFLDFLQSNTVADIAQSAATNGRRGNKKKKRAT